MSRCIAMTKKGAQCKKNSTKNNINICSFHIRLKPESVVINGGAFIDYNKWFNEHANVDEKRIISGGVGAAVAAINNDINVVVKLPSEEEQIRELEKFAQINKCFCCMDESFSHTDLISCSNANSSLPHLICNDCFTRHLDVQLQSGIVTKACMFDASDKCGGEYVITQILSHLDVDKGKKFEECLELETIKQLAAVCDNYQICPLCNKFGCIVENLQGMGGWVYLPCGRCGVSWCSRCQKKSHGQDYCYKFNFTEDTVEEEKNKIIDEVIQNIIYEKMTHYCLKCTRRFVKEEGCNLMTCPSCSTMSCYICNEILKPDALGNKYWHFTGHTGSSVVAKCPLWNNQAGDGKDNQGNTEYNIKQIFTELKVLIQQNPNRELQRLIYKRICIHYKDEKQNSLLSSHLLALNYKMDIVKLDDMSESTKRKLLLLDF